MVTGVVSTANLQGVNPLPASAAATVPQVGPGEALFSCPIHGMRVVLANGESRFFVGGYLVGKNAEEIKFLRSLPTVTEVKPEVKK